MCWLIRREFKPQFRHLNRFLSKTLKVNRKLPQKVSPKAVVQSSHQTVGRETHLEKNNTYNISSVRI